jgi:hypothetical protein
VFVWEWVWVWEWEWVWEWVWEWEWVWVCVCVWYHKNKDWKRVSLGALLSYSREHKAHMSEHSVDASTDESQWCACPCTDGSVEDT